MQFWQCVSTAGFFTAPVRGVYYFRYTGGALLKSRWMDVILYHNNKLIQKIVRYATDDKFQTMSGGATLQLEVGDVVNLRTPAGYHLYDNTNNHMIFSGFLVFPL